MIKKNILGFIKEYNSGNKTNKLIKKYQKRVRLTGLIKYLLINKIEDFEGILIFYFENYKQKRVTSTYNELQKLVFKFENDSLAIERILIFFYRYLKIDLIELYAKNGPEGHVKKTLLHKFSCYPGLITLNVNHLGSSRAQETIMLFSNKFQSEGAKKAVFQDERFFVFSNQTDLEYRPPKSWQWLNKVQLTSEEIDVQNFKFVSKNLLIKLKYQPGKIPQTIKDHKEYLESLSFKSLLSDIWHRSGFNLNYLLSFTFQYWKDFNYQDWIDILKYIKNNGDALFELFTFVYKYLGIDLMSDYAQLIDVDEKKRYWVLNYIANHPGMLAYFEDDKNVIHENISLNDLKQIQTKLLLEGGARAIPINGEDFVVNKGDSILSIPVNGKPLDDWKWAQNYTS